MRLTRLLEGIYEHPLEERFADLKVEGISCDSREQLTGRLFVALPGHKLNGEDFIQEAVSKGARIIAKQGAHRVLGAYVIPDDVCVLDAADARPFLRDAALRFYGHPSSRVKTVGVTGTNGKTTVTYLLEAVFVQAGLRCGVIGTVNHRIGTRILPSKNTTPGLVDNQRYLAELAKEQGKYCLMEVSSHALDQGRVEGIDYACAVFTNLTRDHLDYHKDMEDYFRAKAILFRFLDPRSSAVINIDDAYGKRLRSLTRASVTGYAIDQETDVFASDITYRLDGAQFIVHYPQGRVHVRTSLAGRHNVYNILAAFACAWTSGIAVEAIVKGIDAMSHVPGRLEAVATSKGFFVFIDYAHTDDGLNNVISSLRKACTARIIVVFGCGGDRDKGKRPQMGKVVCDLADMAVVTSDNPRSEKPEAIIQEILAGFTKNNYEVCVDRKEAIGRALTAARAGDVVLLAGKGHEDYQILKDKTIPFNERKIVEEYLRSL